MKKASRFMYIGIDPGNSGALVCINEDGIITTKKCPDKVFDMSTLFALSIGNTAPSNVNLLMERVWARPNNSTRTAFTYGVNYGQWLGIAASHEIKMYTTLPNNWIKWVGCPKAMEKTARKNWLKEKAKELYPEVKRVTLATADAILICHYAKKEYFFAKAMEK